MNFVQKTQILLGVRPFFEVVVRIRIRSSRFIFEPGFGFFITFIKGKVDFYSFVTSQ
jgi:hypothetical protein